MSSCSRVLTHRPVASILPMDDLISGFDFGFRRGYWSNPSVYLAEPVEGIGVIVYKVTSTSGWIVNFFATLNSDDLPRAYAEHTISRIRTEGMLPRLPFYGSLTDVLSITSIINHHTIGDINDRPNFGEQQRLSHAQPEGPASGSCAHRSRNKDVG